MTHVPAGSKAIVLIDNFFGVLNEGIVEVRTESSIWDRWLKHCGIAGEVSCRIAQVSNAFGCL